MWVLILASYLYHEGSYNITKVENFQTEDACKDAGASVQKITSWREVQFTCVRRG